MKELSMHILDIVQNSIRAEASLVEIVVDENLKEDSFSITIKDDGKGMDEAILKQVVDPFFTSRTTRKVGLGIPMIKASAEACEGSFEISSEVGKGTCVKAIYKHSHIDRAPLGNILDTLITLVISNEHTEIIYKHFINEKKFELNTVEIKKILGKEVPINNIEVIKWLKNYINEGISSLKKESEQ